MNPILKGLYTDPDMLKYEDKYYLYPTTDGFTGWSGSVFHAFSSENLKDWKDEGVILDLESPQVPWAVGAAWAPAIFERNGRFYYYFCGKRPDGMSCIGVAVSESPDSGFVACPEPLLTPEMMKSEGVELSQVIDPSVYEEEGEVITVLKRNGLYHFTWSCDDTGSEDYHVKYGVAENLYGPIRYQYPVLVKKPEEGILGTGHHCIYKEPGMDRYYIVYHRFATPLDKYPEGKGYHREVCLNEVKFEENGLMSPVEVN